jgi:hypothetical protein
MSHAAGIDIINRSTWATAARATPSISGENAESTSFLLQNQHLPLQLHDIPVRSDTTVINIRFFTNKL